MTAAETAPTSPAPPRRSSAWAFFVLVGFIVGNGSGFLAGTIVNGRNRAGDESGGGLDAEPSTERKADTAHPRSHERPGFAVRYPGNWRVDSEDAEHDPDHHVTIESPGASSVQLLVRDGPCDPTEELAVRLATYGKRLVQDAAREPFQEWGGYHGSGAELRGKLLGLAPGRVRIFVANVGTRSFTAIELFHDEDAAALAPGFRMVSESFTLR